MSHHNVNQLIHLIWSTDGQKPLIKPHLKNNLYAYISVLIQRKNGRAFIVGGCDNHIHLLTILPPDTPLSKFVNYVKSNSSRWLKLQKDSDQNFNWGDGYLAMSTQEDKLSGIFSYIESDEVRHQSKSYSDELKEILKLQNIDYNEQYYLKDSHSKICVHAIWTTDNRQPYIENEIRDGLYEEIRKIVLDKRGIVHAIGGIADHVHVLMEAPKVEAISDLMRDIKTCTTHWVKQKSNSRYSTFEWQIGYGAFTVSFSCLEPVKLYISNQEEHHRKISPADEWSAFLKNKQLLSPLQG